MHPAQEMFNKHVNIGRAVGAGLGGIGGAVFGYTRNHATDWDGKKVKLTKKQKILNGVLLGASGAYLGHNIGLNLGARSGYQKANAAFRPKSKAPEMPDWLKGAKTKAEAKKAYHAAARANHPDLQGGSEQRMKDINQQWGHWEGKFKQAMLSAFFDEMEKIASQMYDG